MSFFDTVKEEIQPILLDGALKAIMTVSPNDAIKGTENLILAIASSEMTGKEKAKWVFDNAIEFTWGVLQDIIEYVLPLIVKLIYSAIEDRVKEIENGTKKTITK